MNDFRDLEETIFGEDCSLFNCLGYSDKKLAKELLTYGRIRGEYAMTVKGLGVFRVFEISIYGSPRMANGIYQLVKLDGQILLVEPIPALTEHVEGRFDYVPRQGRRKRQLRQVALQVFYL